MAVLSVAACFFAIWKGWIGYVPDVKELDNPIDKFASQVYSSDGKMIGTWARVCVGRRNIAIRVQSSYCYGRCKVL